MIRILKLVLIGWGMFLLTAYSAYAAGNVEVQPYFESGEGVNDAIGFRYRFYVVENESRDSLKAIRGVSRFKGNQSQNYLIETGIYSEGAYYSNESCSDSHSSTGEISPAEASLRIGLPYSAKSSLPGVKTHNPAIFPKITYEAKTQGQARVELASQLNLNGKQGMIEISKGEAVTDKSGWLCEKDLEDIDYIQWNITAVIDSEERRMALALPKESALSLASGALLSLQGESLHSAGAFKVYYWGIEVKRSSGKWESLDKWKITSSDGSLTDYGARKVKYNNNTAIEISNDGSQGEFLAEGEIFSLSAPEDSAPPSGSLSINSGADYANTKSLTLNLSAQDDTGVTGYYLSEESSAPAKDKDGWISLSPVTGYNVSITYSLKDEEKTPNMITLYTWYKDSAGNISETASDSISFDMTAPSLTVTGPTTASVFNTKEASLTLSGTASDDASGVEKITYTGSQGAGGTAVGTSKWSIPGIKLSKGENIFTLTAYDKLNNSAQLSFTANCEVTEPPGIPVFSQKYDGKAVSSGSLSWSWGPAESGGPAEEYWVSPSWLPNGVSTKESSYSLTKKLSKGTYQISIMAKNSAGISKKARDTVVIIEEDSAEETSSQTENKTSQAQASDKSETIASSEVSSSDNTTSQEETSTEIAVKTETKSESKSSSKSDTASSQETYSTPSGFLTIEDGQPYINSKRVKLNLSASDDSGITAYYLSDSPDTPSGSEKDGWILIDKVSLLDRDIYYELTGDDGRKDIYTWFKNTSGRLSSGYSESIVLDTTTPEIENSDYEVTSSETANLSIKADDEESGIKSLKWEKGAEQGTGIYQENTDSWVIKGVALSEGDNEITVKAEDEAGNTAQKNIIISYSPASNPKNNIPEAPSNLSLEVKSSSEITLSWEDNSSNEDGFKIERGVEAEDFTAVSSVDSDKTTFSDSGLKAGKQYYYRLKAYNSSGDSPYSETAKAQTDNKEEIREEISEKIDFIKSSLDRKDSKINDYFGNNDNWDKFLEYNGYIYAALRGIKANKWENTTSITDKEREYIFESLSEIIKKASFLKEAVETIDLDKEEADKGDNYLPAAVRELIYINFMSVYNKKDTFSNYKKEIADVLGLSKDKNKENIISRIFYDFDTLFIMDVEEYEQDLAENHIYRVLEEIHYRQLYSQPLVITAHSFETAGFLEDGPEMRTGRINIEDDLNISDIFYKLNGNIWNNIEISEEAEDKNREKKAYSLIQRAGLKQNNYLRSYSQDECDQCAKNEFFKNIADDNVYCFELNENITINNGCSLLENQGEGKYCIDLDNLKSEQTNACSDNCSDCFIFYLALPEEFLPHLSLAWLNTANALSQARELLGDEESSSRYYEPLNQFLFFADIYSQGKTKVKIYELDEKNIKETSDDVLESSYAGIGRDADNRIKSITISNIKYKFEFDDEGYAVDCQKEELESDSTDYKPFVSTLGVTGKTHNSAKLRGKVNANGLSTQAKFEYGTSSGSYAYETTEEAITGSDDTIVSIAASGLSASTTYYYRLSAKNLDGTSSAEEETFTTEADASIKKYHISGKITDNEGDSLKEVTITYSLADSSDIKTVSTDEDGKYKIEELSAGNYTLTPAKDIYSFSSQEVEISDDDKENIDFRGTSNVVTTYYALTVTMPDNGKITSSDGINCGSDCVKNYAENTQIALTAEANNGYEFKEWSGDCSGSGDCTLTMNANKSASAEFKEAASDEENTNANTPTGTPDDTVPESSAPSITIEEPAVEDGKEYSITKDNCGTNCQGGTGSITLKGSFDSDNLESINYTTDQISRSLPVDYDQNEKTWSKSIGLYRGLNTITVTIKNQAGATATASLKARYDVETPSGSISINNGESSFSSSSGSVTLYFLAEDDVGVSAYYVSKENTSPASDDSGWEEISSNRSYSANTSFTFSDKSSGTKTIYLWYKDSAGNVSDTYSDSITYSPENTQTPVTGGTGGGGGTTTTDTTAPTGSISINSGTSHTKSNSATLNLSASDDIGVTGYYLSTNSATPSSSTSGWTTVSSSTSYSANISYTLSSNDGSKTVYVWYKDAAGKVSSPANDSITLDTTAPTLSITSPTTASSYTATSSSITLSGSASDSGSGISARITWANDKGGSGTASGTTSWSISSLTLSNGSNTITVTAKDSAGNTATDSLSVNYTAPSNKQLTVSKTGNGTISGNGITCGNECSKSYTSGTAVTLTASPAPGYTCSFSGCDSSGPNSCAVTMNNDKNITANFLELPFDFSLSQSQSSFSVNKGSSISNTLSIALTSGVAKSVSFSVSGLPSGANSSFSPSSITPNASTTLTISTTASVPAGNYSVTVTASGGGKSKSVTFNLTINQSKKKLTVSNENGNPPGNGKITGEGINCGSGNGDCEQEYNEGSAVTLTATPDPKYKAGGWSGGGCSGSSSTCTVTMNGDKTVKVNFVKK